MEQFAESLMWYLGISIPTVLVVLFPLVGIGLIVGLAITIGPILKAQQRIGKKAQSTTSVNQCIEILPMESCQA